MESILYEKSIQFAVDLINWIVGQNVIPVPIQTQLLRSGTAVGALVSEAKYAESVADFKHKLKIARKESSETNYWFNIIKKSAVPISPPNVLVSLNVELLRMLTSSIKTMDNQRVEPN